MYRVKPSPLPERNSTTHDHKYKLEKRRANRNTRQKFSTMRVVNDWNNLPEDVVDSPNINTFKNRLDRHWSEYHYSIPNT